MIYIPGGHRAPTSHWHRNGFAFSLGVACQHVDVLAFAILITILEQNFNTSTNAKGQHKRKIEKYLSLSRQDYNAKSKAAVGIW